MCVGADGGGGGGREGGSSRLSVERSFHWQDEEGEKIESIHRPPLLSFELSLSLAGIVSAWCFLSRERKETRIVERKASEQFEEAQSRHERKITPPANARGHHSNSTRHDTLAGLAIALLAAAALLSPVTSELSH